MPARTLMIQGTGSSVGKSLIVAALCRIFLQDGHRVAPFKAQNMALNSFATPDGGEIGRAQAVQAEASGIPPHVDMNPILLKPEAHSRSQVVALGRPSGTIGGGDYVQGKARLWPIVVGALARLREQYDVVIIEGAGSPAEVNLRDGDIVNMRVAALADAPVVLVGDIDRGGVFAWLVGTLELLEPDERARVRGLLINKFRGDLGLLVPGLRFLEQRTSLPVLGVVPYLADLRIAEEDSVALENAPSPPAPLPLGGRGEMGGAPSPLDVAVVQLPHIANFDDFDPLASEPGVVLRYVSRPEALGRPDLVILPGTKTTVVDLAWLQAVGLASQIVDLAAAGTPILGVCGGYQMLGELIADPDGVESAEPVIRGLGLLPVETIFTREKWTCQVAGSIVAPRGVLAAARGQPVTGYEIHMGESRTAGSAPVCHLTVRSGERIDQADGAVGTAGDVAGTYLHGLFANDGLRRAILAELARRKGIALFWTASVRSRDDEYDRLAAHVRRSINVEALYAMIGLPCP
ncbi:MAG: cobyric acid synthase [Chloroflexi bacterium]|nr:cobyric acid synthase [Chloroflexota bacterium]